MTGAKKCLVVGASSFIGVYAVNALLEAGYSVVGTGRNPRFVEYYKGLGVEYLPLDLDDPEGLNGLPSDVDFVAHLAGRLPANSSYDLKTDDDAGLYVRTNVMGAIALLEWCRKHDVPRLVSTTSYADVQNLWSAKEPVREEWPRSFKLQGDHAAYVISKNAACDFLMYYNEQYGMQNVAFRLPPVYGCGPHETLRVNGKVRQSGIGLFIDKARRGDRITVYGDAEHATRDIVYVKDVASAFVAAGGSRKACGLYNIGSGRAVSLLEQAEAIAEVFAGPQGKSAVEVDRTRDNGIVPYAFCIEKARNELGYLPAYSDFKKMMLDWKLEEERGVMPRVFMATGGGCSVDSVMLRPLLPGMCHRRAA